MAQELEQVVKEIMDDLFPVFEALEAQGMALTQFLRDKGIASGDELAPYLQQASDTSNVRWRAVRVRLEHLISGAVKVSDKGREEQKSDHEPPHKTGDAKSHEQAERNGPGEMRKADDAASPNEMAQSSEPKDTKAEKSEETPVARKPEEKESTTKKAENKTDSSDQQKERDAA